VSDGGERCCDLKTVRIASCWEIVGDGEWGKGWLVRCRIRKTICFGDILLCSVK
jgi:hypothetical protein